MAVVRFPIPLMERWTGEKGERIAEILTEMGFPSETGEELEVETTPDRPDILSAELAAYAVRLFAGREKPKEVEVGESGIKLINKTPKDRPYIAALIVRDVEDREWLVEGLIQLQEKIHETLGRKRKKVAVGIHNLQAVKGPILYEEGSEAFVPLEGSEPLTPQEVLERTEQGRLYGHLVENYPLLKDAEGVIAFPPIINSERTKIGEDTKDFFIDITGTHKESVAYTAELFAWALALRGGRVERVAVVEGEREERYPSMAWRTFPLEKVEETYEALMGEKWKDWSILERMGWRVEGDRVLAPSYRYDAWAEEDVVEDVLIARGYNTLGERKDFLYSTGRALKDSWGEMAAEMGFVETYGFFLGNKAFLQLFSPTVVEVANPLTEEANALRGSLTATLFKTALHNKMKELPLLFFEEGRVMSGKEEEEKGFLIADKEVDINRGLALLREIGSRIGEKWEREELPLEEWNLKDIFIEGRWAAFKGREWKALVGEVKPSLLEELDFPLPTVVVLLRRA